MEAIPTIGRNIGDEMVLTPANAANAANAEAKQNKQPLPYGTRDGSQNYLAPENLLLVKSILQHECFDAKDKEKMKRVMETTRSGRNQSTLFDHMIEMLRAVSSAMQVLSAEKGIDTPKDPESLDRYFESLFKLMTATNEMRFASPKWWSIEVIKETFKIIQRRCISPESTTDIEEEEKKRKSKKQRPRNSNCSRIARGKLLSVKNVMILF